MIHVAILKEPYLEAILAGRKTIEMRLTLTNRAPFERLRDGDRVFLKRSGGPFRGTAIADHAMFLRDLTPRAIDRLRRDYNEWIRADAAHWRSKRGARYGTLIWLREVERAAFGPRMTPHHGVAWQCLPDSADVYPDCLADRQGGPIDIALTSANIRHGHIYLRHCLNRFPADALGGSTRAQAGRPLCLRLDNGPTIRTDIVADRKIFRSRAWRSWFADHRARPQDRVRLVPDGPRTFDVRLVKRGRSG